MHWFSSVHAVHLSVELTKERYIFTTTWSRRRPLCCTGTSAEPCTGIMEIHVTSTATSAATIEFSRRSFASLGLPEVVVTDNGTTFTSAEFAEFMKKNGIRHIRSPPYHPSSNGLAERAVQTFKGGMKKCTAGTLNTRLSRFLLRY